MRVYLYQRKTYSVSVIIPMYNAEKYIGECLDSLLDQTFQDFEVIVVDDCSTDNSAKIVESYAPKFNGRLVLTPMEKNTGSGALPRNKGLSISRGEYIQFLDADDMLTKTALEELYGIAKEYNSDAIYCEKHYESDEDGKNISVKSLQKGKFVDKPTLETNDLTKRVQGIVNDRYFTEPWNKFVKRNLIMTNEIFFPAVKISEDNVWNQGILFYAKKFLRVPNLVYIQRMSANSMTRVRKTSQQNINFWLNPVLLGLKYLDEMMLKQEFFRTNLSCRFALLKKFINKRFDLTLRSANQLSEEVIYSTIKNEFGEKLGEYDVLISALCVALYSDKIEVIRKSTARIDFKLVVAKTETANFKIISVSDAEASVSRANWLKNNQMGYLIQSYSGKLDFTVKVVTDGRFVLDLRGIWVPESNDRSKLIPYWIDYTKFTVNGNVIFDRLTPAWHDKTYNYALDVKAGDEVKIQAEWLPHREDINVATLVPAVDKKFLPYLTARADIKLTTTEGGDFQIVSMSDDKAEVEKPSFLQKGGVGYQIQSHAGSMELVGKATVDGRINLILRGMWVPDPNDKSKHIPYWIDYTKFTVNGEIIFDKLTPIWHDEPYNYTFDVKAGKEFKVQFEWLPHRSDVLTLATPIPAVQKQTEPTVDKKFLPYLTARADIKLTTTKGGDFQIVSVSDDKAEVEKPSFLQKGGVGYQIQSHAGSMEVVAKATVDGQINLDLRGVNVRNPKGKPKRIPYWIDYTKFTVNGEIIFDRLTPVWHDEPYNYTFDVKANKEIKIQVEWLPHSSNV